MSDKYWREPKQPQRAEGANAWWYANANSIEIYATPTTGEIRIILSRRQLEAYLRQAKAKEQP